MYIQLPLLQLHEQVKIQNNSPNLHAAADKAWRFLIWHQDPPRTAGLEGSSAFPSFLPAG